MYEGILAILLVILLYICLPIVLFLLVRSLVLWYWKIDKTVSTLELILGELKKSNEVSTARFLGVMDELAKINAMFEKLKTAGRKEMAEEVEETETVKENGNKENTG